jgi:hypothetical protein
MKGNLGVAAALTLRGVAGRVQDIPKALPIAASVFTTV